MRKLIILLTTLALLSSVFATIAVAQERIIEGSGTLHAAGKGEARVSGSGNVTVKGSGLLLINLLSDDATATVRGLGKKRVRPDGTIVYAGYRGHAEVSGSRIKVTLIGSADLRASGEGKAYLRGRGVFHIGHISGKWLPGGVTVYFKK